MELLVEADIKKTKKLIKKFNLKEYDVQSKEIDIGCGADWSFVVLAISGVGSLFFLGDKIEKNLVAWLKIGKRLNKIFKNKKQNKHIFIDKDAAIALAIHSISKKTKKIDSIQLIMDYSLSKGGLEKIYRDRDKNELSSAPYNYYVLIFNVNEYDKYIYCIKSNGDIKYKDIFFDEWFNYECDWNKSK